VSSVSDDNKLLKNPQWRFQATGGIPMNLDECLRSGSFSPLPACSTQSPTVDTPGLPDSLICNFPDSETGINGHVDWLDATYEGTLTWDENSIDHDFNFYMDPLSPIGRLHLEFNSDETIDNFQTPWWKSFHDNHPAKGTALGYTIVTGLVGLDCEHDCRLEVHPVHAIAIRVKEDRADETWAIFVRNWGNEGFCSSQQHYLDLDHNVFTVRLPWNADALGHVTVGSATTFQANVPNLIGPIVTPQPPGRLQRGEPQGGVLVQFVLPAADVGGIVNGELHLQWSGATIAQPPATPPRPTIAGWSRAGKPIAASQQQTPDVEDKLGALVAQMSPAQRQIYQGKLNHVVAPHTIPLRAGTPANAPPVTQPPHVRHVADAKKPIADQLRRDALCASFANNVPGFPKFCAPGPTRPPVPRPQPVQPGIR
jgi:hypothetical protein